MAILLYIPVADPEFLTQIAGVRVIICLKEGLKVFLHQYSIFSQKILIVCIKKTKGKRLEGNLFPPLWDHCYTLSIAPNMLPNLSIFISFLILINTFYCLEQFQVHCQIEQKVQFPYTPCPHKCTISSTIHIFISFILKISLLGR